MTVTATTPATQGTDVGLAHGSVVEVRDEQWLVTGLERAVDGWNVSVQGLTELVQDTTAIFSTALDDVRVVDPADAQVVADPTPGYRRTRLWLESVLRRSPVPVSDPTLTVATQGLADVLPYQRSAATKALDPENLRPRILLADAVGLGKTLEIGMILAELARRGRGDRILVVTPKHVLEQMQFELWTRFALPFVRLDSVGIQRIRQQLPANRNPFSHYKRIIVSIDTLKSDRYVAHLRKQHWDAVVIDESHNVTNSTSQNNRLARLLAERADALVLASATPHNGKAESFAELVRMLDPSAVRPDGTLVEELVERLVVRRHRHSEEVAKVVGADWKERLEPRNLLTPASAAENALARELDTVWLHPEAGRSPYSGKNAGLFPWTLAKAFLSSPAALRESLKQRTRTLKDSVDPAAERETTALAVLDDLAQDVEKSGSAKYDALLRHLRGIGIGPGSPTRSVVFAERIATLTWLRTSLMRDLGMDEKQVRVLHGGLSDVEQQEIVGEFKQQFSPVRVLITGDVASEGVNLHAQCHDLVHFDIPWSLIRIEQRNGRIDRYGQKHSPQITTLLLEPDSERFAGDIRVLERLMTKEHEAHKALGDAASLMGKHDVEAEEEAIRKVLAEGRSLDDVVSSVEQVAAGGTVTGLLARIAAKPAAPRATAAAPAVSTGVYAHDVDYLREAMQEFLTAPGDPSPGGVAWKEFPAHSLVQFEPPIDLRRRLDVLPQSYLADRAITSTMKLVTTVPRGKEELSSALGPASTSRWPEAHYLSPLHPVLDWAGDRALAVLGRNEIFALRGSVDAVTVVLQGTLTNRRGQVVTSAFSTVQFVDGPDGFALATAHRSAAAAFAAVGFGTDVVNTGALPGAELLTAYVRPAVAAATGTLELAHQAAASQAEALVAAWHERTSQWAHEADALIQRGDLKDRARQVADEKRMADLLQPERSLVRPLLVIVPQTFSPSFGQES